MEYRVDIAPKTHRAFFEGEEIGRSEFAAARSLLLTGKSPTDTMLTFFDGKPSMRGSIGWWAAHAVKENEKRGPALVKYRAPNFV